MGIELNTSVKVSKLQSIRFLKLATTTEFTACYKKHLLTYVTALELAKSQARTRTGWDQGKIVAGNRLHIFNDL